MNEFLNNQNKPLERHFPNRNIPFYGNYNGISCGQCVYKMMLAHFFPEQEYSFEFMDKFCGAVPDKGTWPFLPRVNLANLGLDVITYEGDFEPEKFIANPYDYMKKTFSEDVYEYAVKKSDVEQAVIDAKLYIEILKNNMIQRKSYASLNDIKQHIENGYLINLWVNSGVLNNSNFSGHFILVHDFDTNGVYAHDAGGLDKKTGKLNDYPDRYIDNEKLMNAVQKNNEGKIEDVIAVGKKC